MYNTNIYWAGMHKEGQQCTELIERTANALNSGVVALILLSVQQDNLELNIKQAVQWWVLIYTRTGMRGAYSHYRAHSAFGHEHGSIEAVIKKCIQAFPLLWVSHITVFRTNSGSNKFIT